MDTKMHHMIIFNSAQQPYKQQYKKGTQKRS